MHEILNTSLRIYLLMSLSYFTDSGSLKASQWAWLKSGSTGVECPFDHGPASWTSASSQNPAILESCVREWWKTWRFTTATTPSSSWVSSSTACKTKYKFVMCCCVTGIIFTFCCPALTHTACYVYICLKQLFFFKCLEGFHRSILAIGCLINTLIWLSMFLLLSISSPMLLIALAVFAGAFYIIHLKSLESKLVVLGELSNREICLTTHSMAWILKSPGVLEIN